MLPIDKMIITYTFTMARWQIVVKMSEATKQTKDQNNNKQVIATKALDGTHGRHDEPVDGFLPFPCRDKKIN